MPLEIHELIVRATVVNNEPGIHSEGIGSDRNTGPDHNQSDTMTLDAIQQALEIIKRQKER